MGRDGRNALGTRRLEVVNAVRRGDRPFERGGNEAADQVGIGADVDGGDGDRRAFTDRKLAHVQREVGLDAGDNDHQIDHDREHRTVDKDIGK